MEWFFAAVKFLEDHQSIAAFLEVVALVFIFLIWRGGKQGRHKLHNKVEALGEELHGCMDEMRKDFRTDMNNFNERFHKHELDDAERYGKIEGHMTLVERLLNGRKKGQNE